MSIVPPPVIWFRPSVKKPVAKAWIQSATLVAAGAIALGFLRAAEADLDWRGLGIWAMGLSLLASGPIWLGVRLASILSTERVLSLHADGLRWQDGPNGTRYWTWDEIADVQVASPAGLTIEASGRGLYRFEETWEDAEPEAIRRVILQLRQQAMLGLPVKLRPARIN